MVLTGASSNADIAAAWRRHQAGEFAQAAEIYRRILDGDSSRGDVWRLLGAAYHSLRRRDEAIESFRRSLELKPDCTETRNSLAVALAELGRFDEATAEFRRAIALRPSDAELRFNFGLALKNHGRAAEAVAAWRVALELNPAHSGARRGLEEARVLPPPSPPKQASSGVASVRGDSPVDPVRAELAMVLGRAWKAHTSGNLTAAEADYRRALESDARQSDVWYLLGAVCQAGRRLDEAVACFQRALEINSDYADAHNYLAVALVAQGKLDEAAAAFRRASELRPADVELRVNLGLALRLGQRHEEAIDAFREALGLRPEHPKAKAMLRRSLRSLGRNEEMVEEYRRIAEKHRDSPAALHAFGLSLMEAKRHEEAVTALRDALAIDSRSFRLLNSLGLALAGCGRLDEAVATYQEALCIKPEFAEAHNNLGVTRSKQNRIDDAVAHYQEALRLRPDFAQAHSNLGGTLGNRGDFEAAERHQRRAIELRPGFAEAHCNLGAVLIQRCRFDEAEASLRRALELKPNFVEAHGNLGGALAGRGELAVAEEYYNQALSIDPDFPGARYNRSLVCLAQGRMDEGWRDYEFRFRCDEFKNRGKPGPLWDGAPLDGRTVLIHAEQGLGDTIQFVRYLLRVASCGGRVLFECQHPIVPLMAGFVGLPRDTVEIVAQGKLPAYDLQAPLLSLPHIFRTTLETVPCDVPYLAPDAALAERWHDELAATSELKVGIAWQGNPKHRNDARRSIPLATFEPLARLEGVRLFSLQKNHGREQLDQVSFRDRITNLAPRLESFVDTAAVIANLDLVICCDTSLGHLTGALRRPVWMAITHSPDWRWLLEREDSPWYPTLRLFRQRQAGDWPEVFERIALALSELLKSNR
ncbi:MAG TPA: tetratricopeptide repeat protein [Pirellulales bacterium]|nr:tetratricopeptide repeat protein [Pirellulales bacterium]